MANKIYDVPYFPWDWSVDGSFVWPDGVTLRFPDGEEWDKHGGREANGWSVSCNPDGTGERGSPCGQALKSLGLI